MQLMKKKKSYKQTFICLFVFIIVGYVGCDACDVLERHAHRIVSNTVDEAVNEYIDKQLNNSPAQAQENNGIDSNIIGCWKNDEKYIVINEDNITMYDYRNGEKTVNNIYSYLISKSSSIVLDNNIMYKYEIENDCLTLKYSTMSTRENIFSDTEINFTKTKME
jgi:hypothetical protein